MARSIHGCTCSDQQINLVGCDCHYQIVDVWTKGYAGESNSITTSVGITDADLNRLVRKEFGSRATVYSIRPVNMMPRQTVSAEYIAAMSGDNS